MIRHQGQTADFPISLDGVDHVDAADIRKRLDEVPKASANVAKCMKIFASVPGRG